MASRWRLEYRRTDTLALPFDLARKSHVDGQKLHGCQSNELGLLCFSINAIKNEQLCLDAALPCCGFASGPLPIIFHRSMTSPLTGSQVRAGRRAWTQKPGRMFRISRRTGLARGHWEVTVYLVALRFALCLLGI